jgi:hypothetical protein
MKLSPPIRIFLICIALTSPILAQKPTPTPERDRRIVALINDARLAAPELTVETLLKLVETKKVTDPVWRKEIIDEALRMIDDVQYSMPMHAGIRPDRDGTIRSLNDTEAYFLLAAYSQNLDRLSLKGRAIRLLLEFEPQRAKQLVFQMGGDLALKPRSCEDVLTYVPRDIYPVVVKVAKALFSEKQVEESQRALFVVPWIENIQSPRQIAPALAMVKELQGSPAERQILISALSRTIDKDFKDDRSFTSGLLLITAVTGSLIEGEQDPLKLELKNALRSMVAKNLSGKRCKDNQVNKDEPLPDYVVAVNKLVPEKPFSIDELTGAEFSGTLKVTHLRQKSSIARKIGDEIVSVRGQKIIDNKVVNHDANDVEWAGRVTELIDRVLATDGNDGETEGEMLYLKAAFVGAMLSGVDPGELRKSIVRKFLRLIMASKLQKTSFIEWRLWLSEIERSDFELIAELAPEFPNPNLKVIVAARKLFESPTKVEAPAPKATTPAPKKQ